MTGRFRRTACTVFVLLCALPVAAQSPFGSDAATPRSQANAPTPGPDAYGVSSWTAVTVDAWALIPLVSTATYDHSDFLGRYLTGGATNWAASITLPTGVLVTAIELQGCDRNASLSISAFLLRKGVNGAAENLTPIVGVTSSGSTECTRWLAVLPTPVLSDSRNDTYMILVQQPALDGTHIVQGVRVFYQRQISPAPGTAAFGDVPVGHPLHQFVEALAASGITAGCGGGNFCPNDPITRGQMAVFLAKALGLHWPD